MIGFVFFMTYKCQNMKTADNQCWIIAWLLSPAELRIPNTNGYIIKNLHPKISENFDHDINFFIIIC
jgi:hypothetical protein